MPTGLSGRLPSKFTVDVLVVLGSTNQKYNVAKSAKLN